MANKDFSIKLKNLRLRAGYSQKEVYEHFKIPQSTFSSWEVGKSEPSGEMLIKLCEFYKCDMVREFSSDEDLTYDEWNVIEKYRFVTKHSPDGITIINAILNREFSIAQQAEKQQAIKAIPNMRVVNYYYQLASAGTGQIIFDSPPTEKIEIPDIPKYQRADYAIGVNGDSMEPIFSDGDMLLIEMTEDIQQGEIGIFLVDGECYVKKLGDGKLISLNPKYDDIALTEGSKCMGIVLDKIRSIDNHKN